ncbi:MAG: tRNA (adenosine(37)-N6)-threonylcarbamoyltransferase complex transferase subunit TsaD [Ignavibacteria bacterium RBG_16_36_9]|nr:MAG: tRNA (adenosine(37)-N6)-threonylcarbamoyltransferase complex transferase subunit TsaD [Ignavibacteria bacterium RBG_16_36_9]
MMNISRKLNILGIESSCDETSVAILSNEEVKANLISSQHFHKAYGGVVPELSSRAHLQMIKPLVESALQTANKKLDDIDLITATAGPGLIGALLVGLTFAKGLSYSLNKPFVAVNHIEGHIFSGFLMEKKPEFPMLVLVVSGGHTLLLFVESFTKIFLLGTTVDDAAGEAFDKVSKLLGFGYPGGPQIEASALKGNEKRIKFPVAELKDKYNFSFSGLKTAVLRFVQRNFPDRNIPESDLNNISASFQKALVDALVQKVNLALIAHKVKSLSLVGGVAANKKLRNEFNNLAEKFKIPCVIPSLEYCSDNAAMIALRGFQLYNNGITHSLSYRPYPAIPENHFLKLS